MITINFVTLKIENISFPLFPFFDLDKDFFFCFQLFTKMNHGFTNNICFKGRKDLNNINVICTHSVVINSSLLTLVALDDI